MLSYWTPPNNSFEKSVSREVKTMWLYDTIFSIPFVSSCFFLHFVCGYDLRGLEHATNFRWVLFWKWIQVFLITEIFCKKSEGFSRTHFDSFQCLIFYVQKCCLIFMLTTEWFLMHGGSFVQGLFHFVVTVNVKICCEN